MPLGLVRRRDRSAGMAGPGILGLVTSFHDQGCQVVIEAFAPQHLRRHHLPLCEEMTRGEGVWRWVSGKR